MLYELSFITGRPYLYQLRNKNNRRVLRGTLAEAIDLADEICLTRDFDLLDNLELLLTENEGKWETVYDTPIVYVNMFIGRYGMHICLVPIPKEEINLQ